MMRGSLLVRVSFNVCGKSESPVMTSRHTSRRTNQAFPGGLSFVIVQTILICTSVSESLSHHIEFEHDYRTDALTFAATVRNASSCDRKAVMWA